MRCFTWLKNARKRLLPGTKTSFFGEDSDAKTRIYDTLHIILIAKSEWPIATMFSVEIRVVNDRKANSFLC